MDAELKSRWVRALRSGEYKQGRGFLRSHDRYCCLGVLCVVAEKSFEYSWFERILSSLASDKLVDLNDQDRKTFPQIADWIEANIPATAITTGAPRR